jgi:hypothetical protein
MVLFLPGTAEANNCGNAAAYLRDVRTSRVGCVEAKALARAVWRADGCVPADGGGSTARCVVKRYTCTTRRGQAEAYPIRCVRGTRVVRFVLTY